MKDAMRKIKHRLPVDIALKRHIKQSHDEISGQIDSLKAGISSQILSMDEKLTVIARHSRASSYKRGDDTFARLQTAERTGRTIFLLCTHDYGNIGDLAIGYSEEVFLRSYFKDYNLVILTRHEFLTNWQLIKNIVRDDDVVAIHGGGNLGDIWLNEENARRKIVSAFSANRIFFFPQSIKFFDNKELEKSAAIYNAHKHLTMLLRDDSSYEIAKINFSKATLIRTEDIVMNYEFSAAERQGYKGIIFVERNDREKGADTVNLIRSMVGESIPHATSDTVIDGLQIPSPRYGSYVVYDKIDEIGSYELVVTNRLHGAVFALIAGRPVIVVDNSYGKISGALKNISKTLGDRIVFAKDDASNVNLDLIKKMCAMPTTQKVPSEIFKSDFEQLSKQIRQFIETK